MRRPLILLLIALVLPGCGADDTPLGPEPAPAGSAELDLGGGAVAVTDDAGARLALEVPALAVADPVTVTLTPEPAPAGVVASFRVEPGDLVFLRPATVTLTVPDEIEVAGPPRLHVAGSARPGTWDPDTRTLTTTIERTGYPTAAKSGPPAPWTFGEADCLLQLQTLDERAAEAQAWYASDGFGSLLGEPLSEIRALAQVLRFECGWTEQTDEALAALSQVTCQAFSSARADIAVQLASTDPDEVERRFLRVVQAEEGRQVTGAGACGGTLTEALDEGATKYLDALVTEVSAPDYALDVPWSQLWGRMRVLALSVAGRVEILQTTAATDSILYGRLLPQHLDLVREAALDACAETGEQIFLADLALGGALMGHQLSGSAEDFTLPGWARFTATDVFAQIRSCGSRLEVTAYDGLNELLDTALVAPGGEDWTTTTQISVPTDGYLELRGPVRAFLCQLGATHVDDEVLVVKVGDTVLAEREPVDVQYFQNVFDLSLDLLLEEAGIPAQDGQTFTLELERRGTGCSGGYIEYDTEETHTVFAVEVTLQLDCVADDPAKAVHCGEPLFLTVDAPASIPPEDIALPLEFRAGYVGNGDEEIGFAGLPYTVAAVDGDVLDPAGVTGEGGLVQTMIQPLPGAETIELTVTVLGFFEDSIEETVTVPVIDGGGGITVSSFLCRASANGYVSWGSSDSERSLFSDSDNVELVEDGQLGGPDSGSVGFGGGASGVDAEFRSGSSDGSADGSYALVRDPLSGGFRGASFSGNASSSASRDADADLSVQGNAATSLVVRFEITSGMFAYSSSGTLAGGSASDPDPAMARYSRNFIDGDNDYGLSSLEGSSWNDEGVLGPGRYAISFGANSGLTALSGQSLSGEASVSGSFALEPLTGGATVVLGGGE